MRLPLVSMLQSPLASPLALASLQSVMVLEFLCVGACHVLSSSALLATSAARCP
jgi:hypothetical protein